MPSESTPKITEVLKVELVDCTPDPPEPPPPLPQPVPEASPVQQAREATIEQTGADPPPRLTVSACLFSFLSLSLPGVLHG